jgi:hypothetical protein
MSDDELLKIAHSGDELTEIAQGFFLAEVRRRELDLTSPKPEEASETGDSPQDEARSDQELARLTVVYSGMADGELEDLAATGFELSADARQALEAEIGRRDLKFVVAPPPSTVVYELDDTVILRRFRDLPEALLAKGSLESAGIHAFLVDDNMIRMDWFISNLLGGIKLEVRAEDAEAANEILSQPIPPTVDVEGIGEYEQPKCPRCQSLDVNYRELKKLASYGSAYLGVPIPVCHKAWTCHACGNSWEENVIAPETSSGTA